MIKINIHGSCVSRDIFRYDDDKFKIVNYIGRNSIASLSYPVVCLNGFEEVKDARNLSWEERMIYFDCNKLALKKAIADDCDYLIIDLIDERFGLIESDEGVLTYSQVLQRSKQINELNNIKVFDVKENSKAFYDAYRDYAEYLRKNYDVNRIIIHEVYPVYNYWGNDNKLHLFEDIEINKCNRICSKIKKGYELLKKFIPEAFVLKMPHNTVAYENHMWGKATVHFTDEYYKAKLVEILRINEQKKLQLKRDVNFKGIYPPYYKEYDCFKEIRLDKTLITQEAINTCKMDKVSVESQYRFFEDIEGYHFEYFFCKKPGLKLYVVFGGSRTNKGEKREIPYFNRWSYANFLDGSLLIIEDPMFYKYDELLLGWFYGISSNNKCREGLKKLIIKIRDTINTTDDNIIFYSSSGGGTVAINMASNFQGSSAVVINPQLDLSQWSYAQEFSRITNIDLNKQDRWNRNDIPFQIKASEKSNFVICVNTESINDMIQLKRFSEKFNCEPRLGLNYYGNLVIWLYRAKAPIPHTAFETRELIWPIIYLSNILKSKKDINKYKELYSLIGDLWGNIWELNSKLPQSQKENTICNTIMSGKDEYVIESKYSNGFTFKRVDSNYQYVKIIEKPEREVVYKIQIEIEDNFVPYELVLYDFHKKQFVSRRTIKEKSVTVFYDINYMDICNCSLLLYNGIAGHTKGNCITVNKVQVSVVANTNIWK